MLQRRSDLHKIPSAISVHDVGSCKGGVRVCDVSRDRRLQIPFLGNSERFPEGREIRMVLRVGTVAQKELGTSIRGLLDGDTGSRRCKSQHPECSHSRMVIPMWFIGAPAGNRR